MTDIVENQDDEGWLTGLLRKICGTSEVNMIYMVSAGVNGVVRAVSERSKKYIFYASTVRRRSFRR